MTTIASTSDKPRRARKKKEARRWLREAQAIVLLAAAGFALVALATFDPAQAPGEQQGPVGPVGIWLGWAFFHALGYAGFLFPLLLAVLALSAFVRPLVVTRGWPPFAGVGIIVLSATGLLAETSVLLAPPTDHAGAGGFVGWQLERRAEAWRPWRAYAVMYLWNIDSECRVPGNRLVPPKPKKVIIEKPAFPRRAAMVL